MAIDQYEQALDAALIAVHQPNIQWLGYAVLVSIFGKLGRQDEARPYLKDLQRLQPEFSIKWLKSTKLIKIWINADLIEGLPDGLRQAKAPEN